MKILPSSAETQRLSLSHDVVWVLEIAWPDQMRAYSNRPLDLVGYVTEPLLVDFNRLHEEERVQGRPTGMPFERMSATLNNSPDVNASPRALFERYSSYRLAVRLRLLFKHETAGAGDLATVFSGVIQACREVQGRFQIDAVDSTASLASREIGRVIDGTLFPGLAEETAGSVIPWLFGRVKGAQLLPLNQVPKTRLRAYLHNLALVIPVVSVDGFPSSGSVQVGSEVIVYNAVDAQALTLGTPACPVERSVQASQKAGAAVRLIPPSGFQFLVADHPCRAVEEILADGTPVAEASSSSTIELAGEQAQIVTFERWPTRPYSPADPLKLVFQGYKCVSYWKVESNNTAVSPEFSFDVDPYECMAAIGDSYSLLSLSFLPSLPDTIERYGDVTAAYLVIHYEGEGPWPQGVAFQARVTKHSYVATLNLTPPPPGGGHMYATLDVSEIATEFADWGMFKGSPVYVQIQRTGPTGSYELHVMDLAWEIVHEPYVEQRQAEKITATVEGFEDNGELLENPADIMQLLLTHPRLGNLPAQSLDEESWSASKAALAEKGFVFARRIASRHQAVRTVLREALAECNGRLIQSGEQYGLDLQTNDSATVAEVIDSSTILAPLSMFQERPLSPDTLAVRIHYARDYSKADRDSHQLAHTEVLATSDFITEEQTHIMRAQWLEGGNAAVAEVALTHLSQLRRSRRFARATTALSMVHLDPGDALKLANPLQQLHSQRALLQALAQKHPHQLALRLEMAAQSQTVWEQGSARVELASDLSTLRICHAERCLATISNGGMIRLAGQVIERSLDRLASAAITYSETDDLLLFAIAQGEQFVVVLGFSAQGDLLLQGEVSEGRALPALTMNSWCTASPFLLGLGTGFSTPATVYDVEEEQLLVTSSVVENVL